MSKLKVTAKEKATKAPARKAAPSAAVRREVRLVITKRFESVSYSRWRDWRQCAYRAALKHLQKLPEGPEGPALARGNEVHKLAERVILGTLKTVPDELRAFKPELLAFKKAKATPEIQWGFDRNWNPVDWFDWTNCFLRVKADVFSLVKTAADIWDWKTGRYREEQVDEYKLQLELYAPAAMVMAQKAKTVRTVIAFTDQAKQEEETFKSTQLAALKKTWAERFAPMLADKRFTPTPNEACRYCHYRRNNGGPCIY